MTKTAVQVISALFFAFVLGAGMMYQMKPELFTKTEVVKDTIKTELSQELLDSLELSFSVSVKPKVVTVIRKDSTFAQQLIAEIFRLQGMLAERGETRLRHEDFNMGPYGDTLIVDANFTLLKMDVKFRPNTRPVEFHELDTLQSSTFVQSGTPWYVTVIAFLLGLALGLL